MNLTSFHLVNYFSEFLSFAGQRVRKLLLIDILVGFLWFAIESLFILILQGLLVSMGLIQPSITILPSWYPTDLTLNVVILIGSGFLRCLAIMFKNYCVTYSSQVFFFEKRSLILQESIRSNLNLSHNETISTFSEVVAGAGNHVVHGVNLVHYAIVTLLLAALSFRIAFFETLIGVFLLAITIYPLKRFSKKVNTYGQVMIDSWNQSYSTLLNGLKNIFFLRLHEMTEFEIKKGITSLQHYEKQYRSYAITSSLSMGLPQFVGIIVLGVTALIGKHFFNSSPTTLLSFFYLFVRLAQNASLLNSYSSHFKLTSLSFHRLKKLLNEVKPKETENAVKHKLTGDKLEITVRNLVIGYNQSSPLRKPIDASFTTNDLFLVKGPSGSGKTTFLKTLLGDLKPLSGSITYNSIPVEDIETLSNVIGYVGPEPFLIYGTVRENLLYGLPEHSLGDHEIWDILEKVGLKEVTSAFNNKLDEILLDETQLSSGQKQRLSFARALLRRPKLLILDEATANIDFETENRIIEVIKGLKPQMTIFVISHKSSFDDIADKRLDFTKD